MNKSICEIINGVKYWCFNGKYHREDGPAIEEADERSNGIKEWWLNGKRHREDGPAVERFDGSKEWYLNGKLISKGKQPENWDDLVKWEQIKQVMNE